MSCTLERRCSKVQSSNDDGDNELVLGVVVVVVVGVGVVLDGWEGGGRRLVRNNKTLITL
jgi:hypothetical protein